MVHRVAKSAVIVSLVLLAASPAMAGYAIDWQAREAGHLEMWWTENGVRITEYPFVDNDMVADERIQRTAPRDSINDCHERWIRAGGATSETHVVCGYPQPTPTFAETLAPFGDTVTWLSLADAADTRNVFVDISLPAWAAFLDANPLPDVTQTFMFDDSGYCAQLPGYYAMDATTGATYSGEMTVIGTATLTVPEPTAMALLGAGAAAVMVRRKKTAA